jgi:hypothetical protein
VGRGGPLQDVSGPYSFAADGIYNLMSDRVIKDHNDISHHEVAYALLKAVATL